MTADEANERRLSKYHQQAEERREKGLCVACGNRAPETPGRAWCEECLHEKRIKRECLRQERLAAGKCSVCGMGPRFVWCGHQYKLCYSCLKKNRQNLQKLRNYIGIPREERVYYGMCWHCGEPVIEGKKVCQKCYDRLLAMAEKGRENISENVKRTA